MASGYEYSTVPPEMLGEDCGECIHGIPDYVECWECRYNMLFEDYTNEFEAAEAAEDRADQLAVVADALAAEAAEYLALKEAVQPPSDITDDCTAEFAVTIVELRTALEAALDQLTAFPAHGEQFERTVAQITEALRRA